MHIVSYTVIESTLQVCMFVQCLVEVIKVTQTHLHQLLCNLLFAGKGEGVIPDASIVEYLVNLPDRVFLPDAHPVVIVLDEEELCVVIADSFHFLSSVHESIAYTVEERKVQLRVGMVHLV